MNTCMVLYDKSKRKWLCVSPNGDCAAFPAGKEGQAAAERLAIFNYSEKVDEYLEHLETTKMQEHSLRRAISGAFILASECVIEPSPETLTLFPETLAEIIKKDSDKSYYITKGDEYSLYRCNCNDYYKGDQSFKIGPYRYDLEPMGAPHLQGIGLICKHIWAYHLGSLTGTIAKRRDSHDK